MKNLTKIICSFLAALLLAAPLAASPAKSAKAKDKSPEAEARAEQENDLYDEGTDALDEHEYKRAVDAFRDVMKLKGEHQDAAMYWIAYAQNQMGNRSDALSTLLEFQKAFPNSRWMEDARTMEVEIRNASGQNVAPDKFADDDVKIMALQALANSDPERAAPILEGIIRDPKRSPKLRDKAIFVLSQSGSSRSLEVLGRIARDGSNPDLQGRAIRYLGIMGGSQSRQLLADVYQSSNNVDLKHSILKSFMISGDRAHLLTLAKTETNPELRGDAVQQLGLAGGRTELSELYAAESSKDVKKKILQAMFLGGSVEKLGEIARNERDPELRATAIKNLGLAGGTRAGQMLVSIYESDSNPEVRRAVIQGLFLQSNARALIDLARKEKDPEMKKSIISKLSIMGSKEAADYLMEFLRD